MTKARTKPAAGASIRLQPAVDLQQVAGRQAAALERYAAGILRGELPGDDEAFALEAIAAVLREKAATLRQFKPKRPRGNPTFTPKHDPAALALHVFAEQEKHPGESVNASIERVLDRLGLADTGPDADTVAKHYRAWRPTLQAMFGKRRNSKRIVPSSK